MKFDEFGLSEKLQEAISYAGYEKATPIQEKAIPEILNGKDLIACAQTGTGKTAAFILPVLEKLISNPDRKTEVLIIVPTRELAVQIDQQFQGLSYFVDVVSIPIYGGGDGSEWEYEKSALSGGSEIIVATPGKLIAHLNLGYVRFETVKYLILDEADRMLDMGFFDDINKIISYLPKKRQTLMFSATMPPKIRELANQVLTDPVEINIALSKPPEGVLQAAYLTHENQKIPLINGLIADKHSYETILIFSSTKLKVTEIVRALKKEKYNVAGMSSDFEQKEREAVLMRFKSKQVRVLVATDVLSRGIDIRGIDLVINYNVPQDAEDYVHRVGRTARADATGVALTLVNEDEMYKFRQIEKLIEREIIKLPLIAGLGDGPLWNPDAQRNFRNKSFHSKKGKGKGNGNRQSRNK